MSHRLPGYSLLVGRRFAGEERQVEASIEHLNPEGLHKNPAYSQAVAVAGLVTTVYVGGQNAVDSEGNLVGRGDLKTQSVRALRNVEAAVTEAGGRLDHVVKWNVFIVVGQPPSLGFQAFAEVWPAGAEPPVVTVAIVDGLGNPDYLVEIEAIAVIPVAKP
jgi:enamine deaminase RidA (YjgF/YER057c/UK114 family)